MMWLIFPDERSEGEMNNYEKLSIEKLYPSLIFTFVMDELPTYTSYEDRLTWQKVGYLSQQLGASLDEYHFNWYKAGPYSSAYTSILYSLPDKLDDMKNYQLTDELSNKLKPIKKIISSKPEDISTARWLELAASLIYISKERLKDKENNIKTLMRRKPHFDNKVLNEKMWLLLEEFGMV